MPLDIESNQKELNEIATALDQVAAQQGGAIPRKHFVREAERARAISRLLNDL